MIIIIFTLITLALGGEESPLFKPQIYSNDFFPFKRFKQMSRQFPCPFAALEGRWAEERGGAVDTQLQHCEG